MKTKHFAMGAMAFLMLNFSQNASANDNVERVLNELNRQHASSSSLIKTVREPASLATATTLTSTSTKKDGDILGQLTAVASNAMSKFKQSGLASWYGRQFHGKKTASGEKFDMNALTAAHPSLPMNCYVKVTNKTNGQSVVVRINDRGPFKSNRAIDLSYGAAKAIELTQSGIANVTIERIDTP